MADLKSADENSSNTGAPANDLKASLDDLRRKVVMGVGQQDRDVEQRMYEQATLASAHYALERMTTALPVRQQRHPGSGHFELIEHALRLAPEDGFYAEFGVFKGASLAFIAERIDKAIYGFDSFEGLPAAWSAAVTKATFDLKGTAPDIAVGFRNFRLVKGWFRESLPEFLSQVPGPASFLHLDCYLYESTKDVLDALEPRIASGTVIVLREYFNFPGWQAQQFKAFQAFCERSARTYRLRAAFTFTAGRVCRGGHGLTGRRNGRLSGPPSQRCCHRDVSSLGAMLRPRRFVRTMFLCYLSASALH